MKKLICLAVTALFFGGMLASVRAEQPKTEATPAAKIMKHKGTHSHKKMSKRGTGSTKTQATPTAKK